MHRAAQYHEGGEEHGQRVEAGDAGRKVELEAPQQWPDHDALQAISAAGDLVELVGQLEQHARDAEARGVAARESDDVLQRTLLSRPNLEKLVSNTDLDLTITGPAEVTRIAPLDRVVRGGDVVLLGETRFTVIDAGGHTLGHVAYHDAADDIAFVGDTLFMPDVGTARCDFPGGDAHELYRSVRRRCESPAASEAGMGGRIARSQL